MTKRKTSTASDLEEAATTYQVNKLVTANNEREQAINDKGFQLPPPLMLEYRLESFFQTILSEDRYMEYALRYQQARALMLDQVEEAVAQQAARSALTLP